MDFYFSFIAIYPFIKDELFKEYTCLNIYFCIRLFLKLAEMFRRHNPGNWQTGKNFVPGFLREPGKV